MSEPTDSRSSDDESDGEEGKRAPDPERVTSEVRLSGYAVASGTALGPAWYHPPISVDIDTTPLPSDAASDEEARFMQAVDRALSELKTVVDLAQNRLGRESASIFEAQAMILRDETLLQAVRDRIHMHDEHASAAVHAVLKRHRTRLEESDSQYLQERAADLRDTEHRLLRALQHREMPDTKRRHGIVVADTLSAADIIRFSQGNVLGCVSATGGPTSHAALIARALELPTVMGATNLPDHVNDRDWLLLDGSTGEVVVRPSTETRVAFQDHEASQADNRAARSAGPLYTADGTRIQMLANVEFADQYRVLAAQGAEGIGLLRTEMLFMMQSRKHLNEEVQYEQYAAAMDVLADDQPLTIRLLDIGGDKTEPATGPEMGSFLGLRGIRVLLGRPDLVEPQLRAIVRMSEQRAVRMLLPMVTTQAEVVAIHDRIDEVVDAVGLAERPANLKIGIMVEVPAVALQAEQFAEDVDFFALGTNDLTQYTLAAARNNAEVAHYADALHPAVLALMRQTVRAAQHADIPVSICGEVASDPVAVPVLLGLGIRTLSMAPPFIDRIRSVVAQIDCAEAETLAKEACAARDAKSVRTLCTEWQHAQGITQ
ncbi:MAG: phosphoenolpyruvate--protein phosphotransferase [Longimonas sp.]|uniref:phosphoenolpyruvate--protein phosphotransferase n=1 Tax=Longimonas sp. TaxID=2039626 RepID=UPI00336163DD